MDKLDAFQRLAADAAKGELAFPTSAAVAMKIQQAVSDPDCATDTAVKLIQAEPLLAARIVAVANSVAFNRSGREIVDVRSSVTRVGFRTVRTLATALITRQMAGKPADPAHQALAAQLWEHTAHVASLAHVIARRVTKVDPEAAMFAGIVHEVAGFFLIAQAKNHPEMFDGDYASWRLDGEPLVGAALIKMLNLPESLQSALHGYWDGYLTMPPASLADTLLLADALAPVPSPFNDASHEADAVGMAAQIDVALGEDTLSAILAESGEEVSSLTLALKF